MPRFAICGCRRGLRFAVWVVTMKSGAANSEPPAARRKPPICLQYRDLRRGTQKAGRFLEMKKSFILRRRRRFGPSKYFKSWFKIVFWAQKCRKIVLFTEFSAASIHIKFLVISKNKKPTIIGKIIRCSMENYLLQYGEIIHCSMVKEEKICEFISFVHSHPALYNKSDADYKNNDIKNALCQWIWHEKYFIWFYFKQK